MNKKELSAAVAKRTGFSARSSSIVVDAVFDIISERLAVCDSVKIVGFGKFEIKRRSARVGRNIKAMQAVPIPERFIPQFTPGKALLEQTERRITTNGICKHR
jgi:DNA-binding protein HU-beta